MNGNVLVFRKLTQEDQANIEKIVLYTLQSISIYQCVKCWLQASPLYTTLRSFAISPKLLHDNGPHLLCIFPAVARLFDYYCPCQSKFCILHNACVGI